MSAPYVTGPCLVYCGLPNNLAALVAKSPRPPRPPLPLISMGVTGDFPQIFPLFNLNGQVGTPGQVSPPSGGGLFGLATAGLSAIVPPARPTPVRPPPGPLAFTAIVLRTMTAVYLGTCEDSPVPDFLPASVPFMVDESGQTYPFDTLYDGAEATIALTLTVFNENVHALLRGYAAGGALNVAAPCGTDLDGYIGTAQVAEGANVPLWLVFPYAAKDWLAFAGLPPCYRFYTCRLLSHGLRDTSCKPKKVPMLFRAQRFVVPGLGSFLYDHEPGGLPNPD